MEIKFKIREAKTIEKTVNENDLRYNHFFGSLTFKKEKKCITVDWASIPLLDFGVSLVDLSASMVLEKEVERAIRFTNNDSQLKFKKEGKKLTISSSFTQEIIQEDFSMYLKAVERFYKRLIFELVEITSPVLVANEMYLNNFVIPYSFIFASRKNKEN